MEKILFGTVSLLALLTISCSEIKDLKNENIALKGSIDSLKLVIDDLENGADRLWSSAQNNLVEKNYEKAKENLSTLISRHPEFNKITEAHVLMDKINLEIELELKRKESEKQKKLEEEIKIAEQRRKAEEKLIAEQKRSEEEILRKEKIRLENATSKMRAKLDKLEGITWYTPKAAPSYSNYYSFHIYIGKKEYGSPWLRWRVTYAADEWLFVKNFFIKYDDKRYDKNSVKFERDNNSDGIWEWYDETPSDYEVSVLREIADSKSATIRFNGSQYYKDKTITGQQKQAIKDALDAYKALGGS
ncbi:MAG: hypothetical protein GXX85_05505 [Ignavibacteria bacterium]|nr:hypothetical protein [Ignavibacteria bacterium]